MPTRDQVARSLRRSPLRGSAPPPASAAAAAPQQLPPPPEGYAYAWSEAHRQYLLVQVAIPRAAAPVPSRLVGPGGQPLGSPGGSMSTQLLRTGVDSQGNAVDPYHTWLAQQRDLDPTTEGGRLLFLVPDPEQTAREFPTPRAIKPEYDSNANDPFGGRKPTLRIGSIADGSAPVPPGASTDPNAPPVVASSE